MLVIHDLCKLGYFPASSRYIKLKRYWYINLFRIYRTRAPASLRPQSLAQHGRSPRFEDHPTFTTHRSSRSPKRPMVPLLNRRKHAKSNKMPHSNERQETRLDCPAKIKFTRQHSNIIRELINNIIK